MADATMRELKSTQGEGKGGTGKPKSNPRDVESLMMPANAMLPSAADAPPNSHEVSLALEPRGADKESAALLVPEPSQKEHQEEAYSEDVAEETRIKLDWTADNA